MLVSYKLTAPLGNNAAGDVIQLEQEIGDKLVEAGLADEATAEDVGGGEPEDAAPEGGEMVQNAIDRLEAKVTKAVQSQLTKNQNKAQATLPAQVKEQPIKSLGHLLRTIYRAEVGRSVEAHNRLQANNLEIQRKSPDGINEGTNSQGGYLVNPEFSQDVFTVSKETVDLLGMTKQIPAKSNTLNRRAISESSLADGSMFGGVTVSNIAEAGTFSGSLPAWTNYTLALKKFGAFVFYTYEELEDASYPVEQDVQEYVAKAMVYKFNEEILQGGTLEGILNAPSFIGVSTSSSAGKISYADLANVWGRFYPDSKGNAIWLYNPELEAQLLQLTYTSGGTQPYLGLQFSAADPFPYRLFGRPMMPCWACSAPGLPGDIIALDVSQVESYVTPYRVDVSKELKFQVDEVCYRFVRRLDAKIRWRSTITGQQGSTTFSPAVGVASRGT